MRGETINRVLGKTRLESIYFLKAIMANETPINFISTIVESHNNVESVSRNKFNLRWAMSRANTTIYIYKRSDSANFRGPFHRRTRDAYEELFLSAKTTTIGARTRPWHDRKCDDDGNVCGCARYATANAFSGDNSFVANGRRTPTITLYGQFECPRLCVCTCHSPRPDC